MKSQIRKIVLIACAATLAGCGFEVFKPSSMSMESNGITYDMPFQKQVAPSPPSGESVANADGTTVTRNFGFTYYGDTIKIKELDGNLTINGKDYGKVKTGDKVRIDKSGNVTVNGTPRPAK